MVELIIVYMKNKQKILHLMSDTEEQQIIATDAKKLFDSLNKNEKDGKFKKANKFLFANILSCYDPAFFKTYEIFKYRTNEIKKKNRKKTQKNEYVFRWDLREALHHEEIKFQAKFRDGKNINNQSSTVATYIFKRS